ncbi:MAG: hypothetical protein ABL884_01825 [Methyloglobulus sp.]
MSSGINKHFKREAIFMASFPIILILVAMLAVFFLPKNESYQKVKNCRQSGGIYSSEKQECVMPNRKTSETKK